MRRILGRVLAALMAIVIVAALAVGLWGYRLMTRPFKGYPEAETYVEIVPGSSPQTMGRALAAAGVVDGAIAFRIAVWLEGAGRRLQAGEYRFDAPLTPQAVVDRIVRGDVFLRPVTFREGLTMRQMAAIFAERGFGSADEFIAAASKPGLVRALDPQAPDLEGYLFPDTYTLPRRTTADDLVARMVARFEKALTPETRQQAAARGLSVRALVTLASLVEKETAKARRAAARGGGLRQPLEDWDGDAVRSDGHLRARARRSLHGEPDARRSAVRLAVQHLPLCRPAARPDRRARPGVPRGRRQSGRSAVPLFRQPQRRQPRLRLNPRRT